MQAETQEIGGSSLDLINHYYDGPEAEKLRFLRYCEKELGKSTSNGTVSSIMFVDLLQKYCYFRNMRGNTCRAVDASTFTSLPIDVQLAFVNERCSGSREARLECLDYLVDESEILVVPKEWTYEICFTAYPLTVNFGTSTTNLEEHRFSTKGLGEGSLSIQKTSPEKGNAATSEIVYNTDSFQKKSEAGDSNSPHVLQKTFSEPSLVDELETTSMKSGGGAQADLFLDSYSGHSQIDETESAAKMTNSIDYDLPTTSKTSSYDGTKKKGTSKTRKPERHPSVSKKTSSPVLRTTHQPSLSPTNMPARKFSEGSSTAPESFSQFAPTSLPTMYTTEFTLSSLSPSPSKTVYSIQAVSEQSKQDSPEKSVKNYERIALVFGILFVPFVFFLFVKAYQRQRDPRRGAHELSLFEDFSVVSENSAILVAVGTNFKKSDDSSISDPESNSSSAFMGHSSIRLSQRIREAFNKMYQYMEGDDISVPPPPPSRPPHPKISDIRKESRNTKAIRSLPKPAVKPYREIFRPDESSSGEETIGILKIDPGTLLLPSDQVYIQEFVPSRENSEGTIPVIYQLDPDLTRTKSNVNVEQNFKATHSADLTAKTESPDNRFGPFYLFTGDINHTHNIGEESGVVAQSTSSLDDSTTAIKSKPIHVDVLREENSENNFRIVGLAHVDSEASNRTSQTSVPFDEEEEEKLHCHRVAFVNDLLSQSRNKLTPKTFRKLSNELDEFMKGATQALQQNLPIAPHRTASSGNLHSLSSISRSTTSSSSCDMHTIGNSLPGPQRTYTIDVLGEQSPPSQSSRQAMRNPLATGLWVDEIENSIMSGYMSEGPSIVSSQTSCDDVEATLTETGNVAVTTKHTHANRRLRMINMYPLD